MISRVQVLNYRALRYVDQPLAPFQILIGPNASGKSTFLDAIKLLSELVEKNSVYDAVQARSEAGIEDLTWMGQSNWFEIALEADIPPHLRQKHTTLRYEVRIGVESGEMALLSERLWFITPSSSTPPQTLDLFPRTIHAPERITRGAKQTPSGWRAIIHKTDASDYFKSEKTDWNISFRFGRAKSALANVPQNEERFPAASWFRSYLSEGVQRIMLNSAALRSPSPPQSPRRFLPDGSNLPTMIHELERQHPDKLHEWIQHVQTALPDVAGIRTIERPEDRKRYLSLQYHNQVEVPSWGVSDGTLRLLALTILAYLPDVQGVYLIEEPENGVHPRAIETIMQSLQSIYSAQVMIATHSPIIVRMAQPADLLCFARTADGMVDIINGSAHPALKDWRHDVELSELYAGGVLG